MAQVDFSNAVMEPYMWNPASSSYLALTGDLRNSGGTLVTSSKSYNIIKNTVDELSIKVTGTFNTSGTEFYFYQSYFFWKISNISFSSGDTFEFQVNADLVVN